MLYRVTSKTAKAAQRNPCLEKEEKAGVNKVRDDSIVVPVVGDTRWLPLI